MIIPIIDVIHANNIRVDHIFYSEELQLVLVLHSVFNMLKQTCEFKYLNEW